MSPPVQVHGARRVAVRFCSAPRLFQAKVNLGESPCLLTLIEPRPLSPLRAFGLPSTKTATLCSVGGFLCPVLMATLCPSFLNGGPLPFLGHGLIV
jgi:hypothetical protein